MRSRSSPSGGSAGRSRGAGLDMLGEPPGSPRPPRPVRSRGQAASRPLPVPPGRLHRSARADRPLRGPSRFPQTPSTGPLARTGRFAAPPGSPRPPPPVRFADRRFAPAVRVDGSWRLTRFGAAVRRAIATCLHAWHRDTSLSDGVSAFRRAGRGSAGLRRRREVVARPADSTPRRLPPAVPRHGRCRRRAA
jgi:hypothetical protein